MKIKNLMILSMAIIFALLLTEVKSQNFSIGGKIGIDLANYSNWSKVKSAWSNYGYTSLKHPPAVGIQVGAVANYSFNNYIALQAELLLQQKGEKYKFNETDDHGKMFENVYNIKITYITIPILARGTYGFGRLKLSACVGPYVGFGISAKYKYESNGQSESGKLSFGKGSDSDGMTKLHTIDFGLCFGLIPAFELGPGDIFLDLRYDLGLLDVYNPEKKSDSYFSRNNRNFGISLGYLVKLGK